ncbi:MAG: hypothetical protein DRQ88_12900 [Epsilonproteobacteria bacterium]|nr:MAG: hypothetical protein DRQ89_12950 [Campylobacterota bacterium]RLA63041.1 MAG: hypothetical protein DRQ88_12900 [Campylobacterota bacterium]
MILKNERSLFYLAVFALLAILVFDLGNLDAIRQGTESFYLEVSKEMYQLDSYLTPYYRGERHWSKAPLHFLFPFPFYKFGIFSNLFSARLSIVLLTIGLLVMTSFWIKRHFNIEKSLTIAFFGGTIFIIKYARIFMMEIPLSLLTFVGTLYFYDYLTTKKSKYFLISSTLIFLSTLIKGPVSLVLFTISISFYLFYKKIVFHQKIPLKKLFLFFGVTIFVSSLWYAISYYRYGDEFFTYFFLRENLGKFSTQSYPMRHVFQGLLIFSLPWSLFIPSLFLKYYRLIKSKYKLQDIELYLLICLFFFFVIWLIPSQRSHHYAAPAVPFLLTLLLLAIKDPKIAGAKVTKVSLNIIFSFTILIILLVTIVTFISPGLFPSQDRTLALIISLIIFLISSFLFKFHKNLLVKSLAALFFIGCTWTFTASQFFLPLVPSKVVERVGEKDLVAYIKRSYFLEEAFQKKIEIVKREDFKLMKFSSDTYYFLNGDDYRKFGLSDKTIIEEHWFIWRRRLRFKAIINALMSEQFNKLKQDYFLFKGKN